MPLRGGTTSLDLGVSEGARAVDERDYARRMMALFSGFRGAHGTHGVMTPNEEKGGKLEIRKTARTLWEPVTEELWRRHLAGGYYLGIIPIDEEGNTTFGCIDVDRYDIDLGEVAREVKRRKLPVVVCRSKSGGAHVYLFLQRPTPAREVRMSLKQVAAAMGWGDCEIFPKQNEVLFDKGDLGSWLNMPYQSAKRPDRYAVKETQAAMSIDEFVRYAESMRTDLSTIHIKKPDKEGLEDGPPCLQHLCANGFPEGQRNNGFLALATFCKKKYGSKWKDKLEEYNRRYFDPPRPAEEVTDVMRRLESKDYNYQCKNQPLESFCNASLCRGRKYGVGSAGRLPVLSGLSKLDSQPPLWFLDIDERRVELSTRELQEYNQFQAKCMEQLNTMFMPMKTPDWHFMVGDAMEQVHVIEVPREMSTIGQFMELLEAFCTDRHRGEKIEDLWLGKPWHDEERHRHYFRLRDLMAYLERTGFRAWGRNVVGQRLRELGDKEFVNVKGRGVNVFWVQEGFQAPPKVDLPHVERDPI